MNTVCPGFVPHHVKPNRCRRCFKDIQDHDAQNEVTTSFTLPLPRRRRESVGVTESSKPVPVSISDQSASFTITETTSLGSRTRQRSSSTSSWFQEKKVNEEQKEKIDSLFRNADDSRASYRSTDTTDDTVDAVAIISIPDPTARRRHNLDDLETERTTRTSLASTESKLQDSKTLFNKPTEVKLRSSRSFGKADDVSKPPELPPKTSENRFDLLKKTKDSESRISDRLLGSRYCSERSLDKKDSDNKVSDSRPSWSRFGTDKIDSKTSDKKDSESSISDSKPPWSRYGTENKTIDKKVSESSVSDSKPSWSRFGTEIKTSDKKDSESSVSDSKPSWSRFGTEIKISDKTDGESKTSLTKYGTEKSDSRTLDKKDSECKVSDSKPSWSRSSTEKTEPSTKNTLKSKFESEAPKPGDSKLTDKKPLESKLGEKKPVESKFGEVKLRDTRLNEIRARASKFESSTASDAKPKDSPVAKLAETKPLKPVETKPEPKPVLARFSTLRGVDTKGSIAAKPKKPPTPTSSSEEESETKESEDSKLKATVPTVPEKSTSKKPDVPEVALVVKMKPKVEPQKEEAHKEQALSKTQQQKLEAKITELETSVDQLKKQLKKSEDSCSKLEREKTDLQKKQQSLLDKDKEALEKTASELSKMRTKLTEMQTSQDEVKNENKKLKQELKEAKAELKEARVELKEAKAELKDTKAELKEIKSELNKKEAAPKTSVDQLKIKLNQSEALCEELAEENEEIKKEVRDLEQELEELHDNFREDQASEFRGLKKELETATKNCRVLQFKLRKAEKKCELLELDRHGLEDRVREYQAAVRQDVDRSKFKELEKELNLSRNLSVSLNNEIEDLKEALIRAETENETLRQQQGNGGARSATPTSQSRLSPVVKESILGKDYETLSHELYDTMERESDLREQLRFSEEEAKTARRKMSALEQENETLMLQIKKLTNVVRNKSTNKIKSKDEDAEEEEISAENFKIQLDLMDQEMGVLRRKLDDTEKENENLQSEVKYLQEKVINQPLIELPELPKDAQAPGAYWEHKVRLQEYEIRETRKRLIEKDREIERLNTEVEIYRKKASKMMVRSRSLDSDIQVDLKRQLQLVEQEANMLRQKVNGLEADNEKLNTDNKRMTLRLSKKPPPTSVDLLQMDNMELKQKFEEQQRKLEALREELEKTKTDSPVAIIQDYKPRKESLTSLISDNENDLISSLKKKIKTRDEDQQTLQNKTMQLEIENSRLSREYKKLKDCLGTKKRPIKAIRDSATRIELREVVSELQDEISDLQVSLRSREVIQEGLEEELEKTRKEVRDIGRDLKQAEEKLQLELGKGHNEKESLKKELESQRHRATVAEEQLSQMSKQSGTSLEQVKRINELTKEKEEADRKTRAAEEALEKKTQRLRDTQEKLNATTALKEDMARSNRVLESRKVDLEKEVEEHKSLLSKAEARVAELRSQVDKTDRDLTSLRKECNQLRNELEDERTRLKQSADKRQSEVNVSWSREREDLRRTGNELRNRIEHLQHQISENEKIWIEKESRMREDFKKKKDNAVREAREKGEASLELAKQDEKILRNKVQEFTDKVEKMEASLKEAVEKFRQLTAQHRRDKEDWQSDKDDLESQVRAERKKREKLERESEQSIKSKEEELLLSKERLVAMEREQRRLQMQVEEVESLQQKVKIFEKEGDKMREEYELLTSKYDQLEDDFVKTKSGLVQEKEIVETNLNSLRREHNELNFELTSLKETYNTRQDKWIKEKLDIQERLKELTRRLERLKAIEQEKRRLQDVVEEKETLIESYKKEEHYLKDERERLRKRVEDLVKITDAQRTGQVAWTARSSDPAESKSKLYDELESVRRDYEGRMALMSAEIASMQAQIATLASERDGLKSQLSSAERNAEEMRTGSLKRERARHREEADAARKKVHELRYQLEDLSEQLDDAHLENKNLKLQIETDKNTFEIQIAELKSKINQLEEQKILESTRGQTRNIAKTRLELTWEKERTELQHLLSESQKLISDLKTRLEKAEVDKEKEKHAVRKQLTDMRASSEKEHQDSRRKMTELHSSLLEIRESHAKLRGMYDRMKKEREILLKEREEWRQRLQAAIQLHTKINDLAQDVDKVASEVSSNEEKSELKLTSEFKEAMKKVKESFAELQKSASVLKEDERMKRTTSFRRAVSAQEVNRAPDPLGRWMNPQRVTNYPLAPPSMIIRPPPRQKSLHRKSLSLDHTLVGASHEQMLKIWESEGESVCSTPAGSLLSLGGYGYETDSSLPDSEYRYGSIGQDRRRYRVQTPSGMTTDSEAPQSSREGSVDPGGSAESVPLSVQHQKKTLKDKLKMLRRTKSIDVASGCALGSDDSATSKNAKEEKEMSLRSKISRVLKKPLGRSSSMGNQKPGPALPPKRAVPDVVPSRPTAEKPLSASRGELSSRKPTSQDSRRPKTESLSTKATGSNKGRETPV